MRKVMLVVLALAAAARAGSAQEPVRQRLSLEEALSRAEETSEAVQIARAGVQRGLGEQLRSRSAYYPQLNATVQYERALASEFEGVFGGSRSDSTGGAPGDTASGGIDFGDLPFGRENTWRAGLQLSQNLFAGGRIRAQTAIAGSTRRRAEIQLESVRAQALLEMAQAYYDVALSERLLAIAQATLAQSEETLRQVRLARQVGNQPEFELLRAQVQRDNQVPNVIQRRSDRDQAALRLKQLLHVPADVQLELSTALVEIDLVPPRPLPADTAALVEESVLTARAPLREAREDVRTQEAALDIARSQRFPSVSLVSNYTRVNYPREIMPEFDDFRTNWTLGLNLQVPLFTGGRIRGDELVAQAGVTEARARLVQTRELVELDTRSAVQQLAAAEAAWRASAGTVEQAERAYTIAELRYREGVSTQLELSDSRILLQQAQATRARAARDLQVARLRLALLPELPLGAGTAGAQATSSQLQPVQPMVTGVPAAGASGAATMQGAGAQGRTGGNF